MNADVNKILNNNFTNSPHQGDSGGASLFSKTVDTESTDAMDTANFPPLDELSLTLEIRGISIDASNHAVLQQQLQQDVQLAAQRLSSQHQYLQQKHQQQLQGLRHLQYVNSQVQKSKKNQNIKQSTNKVSFKRKKSSAESLSDLSDNPQFSVDNNNRYASLSELDITTTPVHIIQDRSECEKINNVSKASTNAHSESNGVASPAKSNASKRFCPPIILFNVNINGLVNQLKCKFPDIEIKIVNSDKHKSKLYVKDLHAYTAIMKILKEKKISSHSFTPVENKQFSLIIRGLHSQTPIDEIKADIETFVPNIISDVKNFTTPYMKKNGVVSDLFLVTLLPGKSYTDVINIKYLLFQKISWEKPHSSAKEIQCKRCQRWGHIAKNCNHVF